MTVCPAGLETQIAPLPSRPIPPGWAKPPMVSSTRPVFGFTTDTVWSHAAFANAHHLPFELLVDDHPRGKTGRAYGVYDPRRQATRRALFVIDATGTITWSAVFPDVVDPGADGILTALEGLPFTSPM